MQNSNAKEDCHIFLTKPLGIGILSTAQKQKKIEDGDIDPAIKAMTTLNKIGADLAKLDGVIAMTKQKRVAILWFSVIEKAAGV